jgi:hypothetical protein
VGIRVEKEEGGGGDWGQEEKEIGFEDKEE